MNRWVFPSFFQKPNYSNAQKDLILEEKICLSEHYKGRKCWTSWTKYTIIEINLICGNEVA